MKRISLLIVMSCFVLISFAQNNEHVSWTFEAVKKAVGQYEVVLTATVDKTWHIYSQNTGKGGPIATSVHIKPNPLIINDAKVEERGKLEKVFDKSFKTNVLFYANKVSFVQKIKVKGSAKTNISGTVDYMLCDDEQCLPPTKKTFNIQLP